MTDRRAWLRGRRPAPPAELAAAIDEACAAVAPDGSADRGAAGEDPTDILARAAADRLAAALRHPGRVRASAFELLTADALLTYASEAALESSDPVAGLDAIAEALFPGAQDS